MKKLASIAFAKLVNTTPNSVSLLKRKTLLCVNIREFTYIPKLLGFFLRHQLCRKLNKFNSKCVFNLTLHRTSDTRENLRYFILTFYFISSSVGHDFILHGYVTEVIFKGTMSPLLSSSLKTENLYCDIYFKYFPAKRGLSRLVRFLLAGNLKISLAGGSQPNRMS